MRGRDEKGDERAARASLQQRRPNLKPPRPIGPELLNAQGRLCDALQLSREGVPGFVACHPRSGRASVPSAARAEGRADRVGLCAPESEQDRWPPGPTRQKVGASPTRSAARRDSTARRQRSRRVPIPRLGAPRRGSMSRPQVARAESARVASDGLSARFSRRSPPRPRRSRCPPTSLRPERAAASASTPEPVPTSSTCPAPTVDRPAERQAQSRGLVVPGPEPHRRLDDDDQPHRPGAARPTAARR